MCRVSNVVFETATDISGQISLEFNQIELAQYKTSAAGLLKASVVE